jgi:hypothetical protein
MVGRAGPAHERQGPETPSWRSTPAWQATGRRSEPEGSEHVARQGESNTSAGLGSRALLMVRRAGPAHERQGSETPF